MKMESDLNELFLEILTLEPEPELMFIIHRIFSLVISLNSESEKFVCVRPQELLTVSSQGLLYMRDLNWSGSTGKWNCIMGRWVEFKIKGEEATTYFCCRGCNGYNHEEYETAPDEIRHHLHRNHTLQLVKFSEKSNTKGCHCCCHENLKGLVYCCLSCDFAMNIACVKKPPILLEDHSNWHEITCAMFPSQASIPCNLCTFSDSSYPWESKFISIIIQLMFLEEDFVLWKWDTSSKALLLISQILSLVSSLDLNSQANPESEVLPLVTQAICVFNSMDLNSHPRPLSAFLSSLFHYISLGNSTFKYESMILKEEFGVLLKEILTLEPEPELMSIIRQILSLVISMNSKSGKFISMCPDVHVELKNGKIQVCQEVPGNENGMWECLPGNWVKITEAETTNFICLGCNGKNHEDYKQVPLKIKHNLHRKHFLQLVLLVGIRIRKCYCCDEDLQKVFYGCLCCDFGMRVDCVSKPPVLSIDHSKWHEHPLYLFPRHAALTCNLCALADASSPVYMCPNCDFVAHLRCINLPRVIKISRHHHRISFTPSFDQGDWSCGVCRRKIENDYGGYSCSKGNCCSFTAHSRCATQSNVWDGKELEGVSEEEIEEVEPFVRISDGIIQHFTHQDHHLKLDENTDRDYDENKQCEACHLPIYIGNFYSCKQCDFILHEECANLSRKIHHPMHQHLLTLGFYRDGINCAFVCSACPTYYPAFIYYECSDKECSFMLHVKCATVLEPLIHESHNHHPLFLTSKPEEEGRICSVCKESRFVIRKETFNCIECDFALCFRCATLPHKVRYTHDKHMLTLSYGQETSTMTYWCEVCEGEINPKNRFYVCDEYCCVTLHIECLLGQDLYMKPAKSSSYMNCEVDVLTNNHMSRPTCYICEKRCPHKTVWGLSESILFCCSDCLRECLSRRRY